MYDRIRTRCKELGYTVQAVEQLAGLSQGSIIKWRTSVPKGDALLAVARILQVSPHWLLYGEDQPEGNVSEIVALAGTPSAEYLQRLKDDPNIRMMFDLVSDATQEEVEDTVRYLQFLRHKREENDEST